MNYVTYFSHPILAKDLPDEFPSPFNNSPHPLAKLAGDQLQDLLARQMDWGHDFQLADGGKMFGVLVVRDSADQIGFLSAFSGMLAGKWNIPGFVPPVFNEAEINNFLPAGEASVIELSEKITELSASTEYQALKQSLATLERQYATDCNELKKQHRLKKMLRDQQRVEIVNVDNIACAATELNTRFERLAIESQRDKSRLKALHNHWQSRLDEVKLSISKIENQIEKLIKQRTSRSRKLHKQIFSTYTLSNVLDERRAMSDFYFENNPPGGAGDCAAPKLLNYAMRNKLTPLALGEFWWGSQPSEGVRHHKHYYPSCRGKCLPILPFMLKGLSVQQAPLHGDAFQDNDAPETIYEDNDLLVVNKPSGLLSVPGKEVEDSVLTRLQQRYPEATGPLLLHRLDMATSGLLLVAKNQRVHKALQQQFIKRVIEKRYVAILSKDLSIKKYGNQGIIELPLRVDLDDRPRQMVCITHGKKARTGWEIISQESGKARVYFYLYTGRTHQLRVHASHKNGLNASILGDELYGEKAERLYLHSERLRFIHPVSGEKIEVISPAPF